MINRFKNILYVLNQQLDESSTSLMRAVSLANNNQANLTLLYVLPKLPLAVSSQVTGRNEQEIQKNVLTHQEEKLHQLLGALDKKINAKIELRIGKKYIESIRAVLANDFDLMIKEADEMTWLDRFIGSDDMHLLRKCPCPVWLMTKYEKSNYDQIMAAVDFDADDSETCNDELNKVIIDLASSLSLSDAASLHVVNAYNVPEAGFISLWAEHPDKVERELFESMYSQNKYQMHRLLNELKQRLGEKSYNYLSPHFHIVKGEPAQELLKVATNIKADLVVMGTVARTGIAGAIIGNTAETVLSQLQCSVLAIKPKGFVSPVS